MHNSDLIDGFVDGWETGKTKNLTIEGNKLYSYAECIAIRDEYGDFVISNRASCLGGYPFTVTTSKHIQKMYNTCKRHLKFIRLVDGWAELGKPRWYIPEYPTHKTVWGLVRCFGKSFWHNDCWTGEWLPDIGQRRVEWRFVDNRLMAPKNQLVAVRKLAFRKLVNNPEECDIKDIGCDECPAKFLCMTDGTSYNGMVFFIAKGKYTDMVKEWLVPAKIVNKNDLPFV